MVGYETGISDMQIHKLALSTTLGAFENFILFGGVAVAKSCIHIYNQ